MILFGFYQRKRRKNKGCGSIKLLPFVLLLIVLVVVSVAATLFVYTFSIVEIRRIDADVKVSPTGKVGVNVDTDALHYSYVPQGSSATKWFNVENKYRFPLKIQVKKYGDIAPLLEVEQNNFFIRPGETKKVDVVVHVPQDTIPGNYSGYLKVFIKRF